MSSWTKTSWVCDGPCKQTVTTDDTNLPAGWWVINGVQSSPPQTTRGLFIPRMLTRHFCAACAATIYQIKENVYAR